MKKIIFLMVFFSLFLVGVVSAADTFTLNTRHASYW